MSVFDLQSPTSPIVNIKKVPQSATLFEQNLGDNMQPAVRPQSNSMMPEKQPTLMAMDSETQTFHKYLDRVQKIIEGRSKKMKRTPVSRSSVHSATVFRE